MKCDKVPKKLVFAFALLVIIVFSGKKSNAQLAGDLTVGKYCFYMELDRIFTTEDNLLQNIHVEKSEMSKDSSAAFIFGRDRTSNGYRAFVIRENGLVVEEIPFWQALEGHEVDTWPLVDCDISADGKVVFFCYQNHIYRYEDGKYEFLFSQLDIANDELTNMNQIECTADGNDLYIRDWEHGVFSIAGKNAGGAGHVVKPLDIYGGSTKKATRFDGPFHICDDAENILFFVTQTYSETEGILGVNEMYIKGGSGYVLMSKDNYGPKLSAISGDGKVIVYRDTDGTFIAQDEGNEGQRVYLKNYTDALSEMDISHKGSRIIFPDAYMVETDGSEAFILLDANNKGNFCLNDSANIIGFHYNYGGDNGWESAYYKGYINQIEEVEGAPIIYDISVSPAIETNGDNSLVTVSVQVVDAKGTENITDLSCNLIDESGLISTILSLWDNGGTDDELEGDGIYSRNLTLENNKTIYIRSETTNKEGKMAIAIAPFNIDPTVAVDPVQTKDLTSVNVYKPYRIVTGVKTFEFSFDQAQQNVSLVLYNALGQCVKNWSSTYTRSMMLDMSTHQCGIYFAKVKINNKVFIETLIVK